MELRVHLGIVRWDEDYRLFVSDSKKALRETVKTSMQEREGGDYVCEQNCSIQNQARVTEMLGDLFGVCFENGCAKKQTLQ